MHYTRCIEKWYGQQEEDPFFRQKSWNLNDGCRSIAIPLFLMFSKSFGMGKVVSRQLRSRLTCSLFSLWGIWWSMKDGEESERATVYSHPCPFKSHWVSSVLRPSWHSSNTHTHTHKCIVECSSTQRVYCLDLYVIMTNSYLLDTAGTITTVKYVRI